MKVHTSNSDLMKKESFLKGELVESVLYRVLDSPVAHVYMLTHGEASLSIQKEIQNYVGETVTELSKHQFDAVLHYVTQVCSAVVEEGESEASLRQLQCVSFLHTDTVTLPILLKMLSTIISKFEKDAVCEICLHIYTLVLKWIEGNIGQFVQLYDTMKNVEGANELMDVLLPWSKPHKKRFMVDGTCLVLLLLCPSTLKETLGNSGTKAEMAAIKPKKELLGRVNLVDGSKGYALELATRGCEILMKLGALLCEKVSGWQDRAIDTIPDLLRQVLHPCKSICTCILSLCFTFST
jgi:hypothetical protein